MPQIPDQFLNSVVILLDIFARPQGTAFVLRSGGPDAGAGQDCFLVTCEHCTHVAAKARFSNGLVLTLNKDDWFVPRNGDDIAVLDVSDVFDDAAGGIGHIEIYRTIHEPDQNFNIGSELYMLGLLLDVDDIGENVPRARFGNLSAFASSKVDLEQGNKRKRPCHLGDMRSRTGFSGAPVIAYIDVATWGGRPKSEARLLGMHCAQHRERITLFGNDKWAEAEIASSMTRIVPATSIWDFVVKAGPV